MKKLFVALLVGSLLVGSVASASTLLPQCKPQGGGTGIACTNASVDSTTGNWSITGVLASIGQITNLVIGDVISFSGNVYSGIRAYTFNLAFTASTFVFQRWDGQASCNQYKTLDGVYGVRTVWTWYDNNAQLQTTVSLKDVPAQCRTNE